MRSYGKAAASAVNRVVIPVERRFACFTLYTLQWGPLGFHKQSLSNLQKAMHKTRKLCAIMVDTIGREILINREAKLDARGWPVHQQVLSVKVNDRVRDHTGLRAKTNVGSKIALLCPAHNPTVHSHFCCRLQSPPAKSREAQVAGCCKYPTRDFLPCASVATPFSLADILSQAQRTPPCTSW